VASHGAVAAVAVIAIGGGVFAWQGQRAPAESAPEAKPAVAASTPAPAEAAPPEAEPAPSAPAAAEPAPAPPSALPAAALLEARPFEPAELARLLAEDGARTVVLDLRTKWEFDEYHVPGARRVDARTAGTEVRSVPVRSRVVLVDHDGALARATASAVAAQFDSAEDAPELGYLVGGTDRFRGEVGAEAPLAKTANE